MFWLAVIAIAAPPNVVVISLDTTRVDALSCYGVAPGPYRVDTRTTPHLDAFAAEGARFERAFTHAPSTLTSHASLFTGLDPHGHAIARNGFPLRPGIPTLAEVLTASGFDTIAVVGSAALEHAMGLDRGFRVYDDTLPSNSAGLMLQATADNVVDRAFAELDARGDSETPLFLFVHFYDAHAPYTAPAPFVERFADPTYRGNASMAPQPFRDLVRAARDGVADPADLAHIANLYLAEVAFVDDQVGRLLEGLTDRKILDRAIVIIAADHGETLSDEPLFSWSHGSNVALEVMRIPLLVRGYGVPLASRAVIPQQVGLSSLAPTVEVLLGQPTSLGTAIDFADLLAPGPVAVGAGWPEHPSHVVFVEATRPRQVERSDAWNNLDMHRGVWLDGRGGFTVPYLNRPLQIYDWGAPVEPPLASLLLRLLGGWDAGAPTHALPYNDVRTTEALKALGYVD